MGRRGLFITVEGIDGSGKTTQARLLRDFFVKHNIPVILTKEPGGTPLGKRIRSILLNEEMNPVSEFLLFASDRKEHIDRVIRPALKEGKVVISDRFHDSSVAYQGYGRGVPLNFINSVHNEILQGIFPDITILVDVSPEVGLSRLHDADRIERAGASFLQKTREGYLTIAKQEKRFFVVDGKMDKKSVHKEIVKIVQVWRDKHD